MRKRMPSLCAGAALLGALCGLADDAQAWDFARGGPYAGVAGSYAIDRAAEDAIEDQLDALGYAVKVDLKDSFGVQGRLGWRFARHFAAEIQAESLFGFETRALGQKVSEHEMLVGTLNAKLPLSISDIQPFLLVGVGAMYVKLEDNLGAGISVDDLGPVLRAGGGLDFYLSRQIVLSVDTTYVLPFDAVQDLDYLSVGFGLQFRF